MLLIRFGAGYPPSPNKPTAFKATCWGDSTNSEFLFVMLFMYYIMTFVSVSGNWRRPERQLDRAQQILGSGLNRSLIVVVDVRVLVVSRYNSSTCHYLCLNLHDFYMTETRLAWQSNDYDNTTVCCPNDYCMTYAWLWGEFHTTKSD